MGALQKLYTENNLSSQKLLSGEASLDDLFSRMESPDREAFESLRNLRVEAAFLDRFFIVYRTPVAGEKPEILTQMRVVGYRSDARTGSDVEIEDMTTKARMTVGYTPRRLFGYDIFVGVAPHQRVNWDAKVHKGEIYRSMSFGLLIKQQSKPEFQLPGQDAIETPAGLLAQFPWIDLHLMKP